MKNTLLVQGLQKLDAFARRRFLLFVQSPYHNPHEQTSLLAQLILAQAPNYTSPDLDKIKLWRKLYPKTTYEERNLNNLISDLLQLYYRFVTIEKLLSQDSLQHDLLSSSLLDNELYKHGGRILNRWEKQSSKYKDRASDHHYYNYRRFETQDRLALLQKRQYSNFLQQKNEALDLYYYLNKLRIACDMVSRSSIIQGAYQIDLLEELSQHFEGRNLSVEDSVLPLMIYQRTLWMLQAKDAALHFSWLKDQLAAQGFLFPNWELRTLYSYLINFCIRQINSGNKGYYQEVFNLYQSLLDQEVVLQNGLMTEWTYTNIITTGLRLKEYDWTEHFIRTYQERLPNRVRHNAYNYNLTALLFERGDLETALQQLHEVEFTDAFYHMAAKIIQLKIYYLQQADEALLSLAEATRIYLRRNRQLSDYQQKGNKRFLQYLVRIVHLREQAKRLSKSVYTDQLSKLQQEIQQSKGVVNREWLLGQLAMDN